MTTPEILTFLLLFCAVSYLVSGLISVRNIIRYRRMAVDLDEDVISRSPFQPSISIVVKLDLRKEKPLDKIEKLLQMRYRNYDVIAVCNSRVDPKEFGRILRRFRLEPDPSGTLYASTDETWSRLRVADRPIHRTKRIIECGISLSRKRYIVPIYDIDCILSPNSLSKTATLIMREPEGRALNLTGAHRYITDGSFRHSKLMICSDLNNLRRIYLNANVCDKNNDRGLKFFPRLKTRGETSCFIPEPLMHVVKKENLGSYLEVLSSGMLDRKQCSIFYNMSELFLSALFITSLVMILVSSSSDIPYLALLISSYMLVLLSNTLAIYIMEIIMPESINLHKTRRLLLMSFRESLLSLLLIIPAWILRILRSIRINFVEEESY